MFLTHPMSVFEGCKHQSVANQNLVIPCTKWVMVVCQTFFLTDITKKKTGLAMRD